MTVNNREQTKEKDQGYSPDCTGGTCTVDALHRLSRM